MSVSGRHSVYSCSNRPGSWMPVCLTLKLKLWLTPGNLAISVCLRRSRVFSFDISNIALESTGVRVLYIAPESYPDEVLPLNITPQPDVTERVLMGRVEVPHILTSIFYASDVQVILKAEEDELLETAISAIAKEDFASIQKIKLLQRYVTQYHQLPISSIRFAESKLRTVLAGTSFARDAEFMEQFESFISKHLIYM